MWVYRRDGTIILGWGSPGYDIYCIFLKKCKSGLWMLQYMQKKRCRRCVLIPAQQCLHTLFCLSVTFPPFSFLDIRKLKCFHTSDIKLNESIKLLHLQYRPFSLYCYNFMREQSAKDDGLMVASFCCASLWLKEIYSFWKTYCLEPSYVHNDIKLLLSPWYSETNNTSLVHSHCMHCRSHSRIHKLFSASLILEEPRGFTSQVIVEKESWPAVKT